MRLRQTCRHLPVMVLLLFGTLLHARAAVITSVSTFSLPGFSTGTLGPVGGNPAPNNDNAVASSLNVIPYTIFYNAQGIGITDVEYVLNASGGTTEYLIRQTLINNTGQPWTDFHFELGFGVGAAFVRSGPADLLDFDTPERDPAPTSSAFAVLNHQPDILEWRDGLVPSIGVSAFSFSVDVPDNLQTFHPGGLNRFTLRQYQTVRTAAVPEPGVLPLLFGGGIGGSLCLLRRPRKG